MHADEGFTLVELLIAVTIFAVLIAMTAPLIESFYNIDAGVTNTVGTVSKILPASTVLEQYLRSAVAASDGTPVFAPIGSPAAPGYPAGTLFQAGTNQMAFYSNTGDLYPSGSTGVPVGPRLVTFSASGPQTKIGYTLTLTSQKADRKTCPGASPQMNSATGATCTFTTYPTKQDFSIDHVTNGSATDSNPVFQYIVGITPTGLPNLITPANQPASGWTCGATCVPVSAAALETVTGVQIDLETQNSIGALTSFRTTVLFYSPAYSTNVG